MSDTEQAGLKPHHEAADPTGATELRAVLRASGGALPAPLQDAAFSGANNAPEFVVESAEGVATFQGFNGENPQPEAESWLKERFRHIAAAYPAPSAPAEQRDAEKPDAAKKPARGPLRRLRSSDS